MNVLAGRVAAAIGIVAAVAGAALTLVTWVNTSSVGMPFTWDGLGRMTGAYTEHYRQLIGGSVAPLGWFAVVAALGMAASCAFMLLRVPRLATVLIGVVTAILSACTGVIYAGTIRRPPWLLGGLVDAAGQAGLSCSAMRPLINVTVLTVEAVLMVIVAVCAVAAVLAPHARTGGTDPGPGTASS